MTRRPAPGVQAAAAGVALLLLLLASGAGAQVDLSRYRGRNRLLFLFAPSAEDASYRAEAAAASARAADLREREILVAAVFERGAGTFDGRPLAAGEAAALRRRFRAPAGRFAAVLLGKDGRTTLRLGRPAVEGGLFPAVDAMPMRREEVRRRGR